MSAQRVVVVGASSGGVRALQVLASQLPLSFPAPVVVVQHIGSFHSTLPQLMRRGSRLLVTHALDGEKLRAGQIYVAPPDHHVLVDKTSIRLSRGPKEHHTRPAIDPLFRSAALTWGNAAIGVLLTGLLDDGTAGLQAIKDHGGIAVVQDPGDAETPSMPLSAIRHVHVDRIVRLAEMGETLSAILAEESAPPVERQEPAVIHENEILLAQGDFMEHLKAIGTPSSFVCPDCKGGLWEIERAKPRRFRCHTGHAFTLRSLLHAQAEGTDMALWTAYQGLQEKEMLLKSLAEDRRAAEEAEEAARLESEAEHVRQHGEILRGMIERLPSPPE
jgi:Chemotaxis response regulator containing a CheY-like receiver domain and a methylesterase domain